MRRPKVVLTQGVQNLAPVLIPKGFLFRFGGEGRGAGGEFAWGEFICDDRRLALHLRHSLGLVRYHIDNQSATHEFYMRELGVWEQCAYPDFSDDPLSAFRCLAQDLRLAEDFLSGSAAILRQAAIKESAIECERNKDLMAGYVGDKEKLEKLRNCVREKRYSEVVKLSQELKYPERMTQAELRMVEIAFKKIACTKLSG